MATRSKSLPDAWVCCNCCSCRRTLSGLDCAAVLAPMSPRRRRDFPPLVAGRIRGRPYCAACLETARQTGQVVDAAEEVAP